MTVLLTTTKEVTKKHNCKDNRETKAVDDQKQLYKSQSSRLINRLVICYLYEVFIYRYITHQIS